MRIDGFRPRRERTGPYPGGLCGMPPHIAGGPRGL